MTWNTLSEVVYRRTYSRKDNGRYESWPDTVDRVIRGNVRNHNVGRKEIDKLRFYMENVKATPAGRGLWFSGSPVHDVIGGAALNNCWALTSDTWENFVLAQDLLMLGGGVGLSVEHKYVSKLPKVKSPKIYHKATKDADYIVPDSREGWCNLMYRVLEAFFVTGKSFSYSTVCIRGKDEPINGFGGKASGPIPLIDCVEKLCSILSNRSGRHIRPLDAADIICCIGEMVVSGNIRRSAIIILGDCWDREYLTAKRWDLRTIPSYRAFANFSVVCSDTEDLHPSFWKTYEAGEPFGIVNRKNIQRYGRMGELRKDTGYLVNPCAEATLENGEPCDLAELFLPNMNKKEFHDAAILMYRYCKRVCMEDFHHESINEVVRRNMRVGVGITGCLQSDLFTPSILDSVYAAIQAEDARYSEELGVPRSIRTTLVKPSGTLSWLGGVTAGIHPAYSEYFIRRIRFSSSSELLPALRDAGHHIEFQENLDGSTDTTTVVADFYVDASGAPTVKDIDTWKQLEIVKMAQKHWADQAVSVTVYYSRNDVARIKEWLTANIDEIKTISFLCHSEHGFKQAPLEAITEQEYDKLSSKLKPIDLSGIGEDDSVDLECAGGACPVK